MARPIDTSVFIGLERRGLRLSTLDASLGTEPFALTSITASDLLVGIHRAAPGRQRSRRLEFVEAVLDRVPVLPFDLRIARTHASLLTDLAAAGEQIGPNDLLIAATALAHGFRVLTHNVRHFARVPGLIVHRPDW